MEFRATDLAEIRKKLGKTIIKNRYILIILAVGLLLLLWPSSRNKTDKNTDAEMSIPEFSISDEEERIKTALSKIDGVGRIDVTLTLKSGISQKLAENSRGSSRSGEQGTDSDSDTTVVTLSSGSGTQTAVAVKYYYPEYQGALVICEGGSNPDVKLQVTSAVSALTGLGSDRISVLKMNIREVK